MACVWFLFSAAALILGHVGSVSFDDHRLRGGRDEVQIKGNRILRPKTLAVTRKATKPKSAPTVEDINATAALLVTNANDTVDAVFADMMKSLDDFTSTVAATVDGSTVATTVDGSAKDSIVVFNASISQLVDKAREELTFTTIQTQTTLKVRWAAFDAYAAKANSSLAKAMEAVDKVVQDAQGVQADEDGEEVLSQMKCCSDHPGSGIVIISAGKDNDEGATQFDHENQHEDSHEGTATSGGPWDWIKSVFGSSGGLCEKAHRSISSANSTIAKLSEGLASTNVSVSKGIHEWGDAIEACVQSLQTDVNSSGAGMVSGILPEVSEALEVVPAGLKKSLKGLHDTDVKAAKSLKNSEGPFKAVYDFVNDLDLQATTACTAKAAAKKKSAEGPCDHRC